MRSTLLYAPDGMAGFGRHAERFDDGLVHNHHWAVTSDEAYPCQGQNSALDSHHAKIFRAPEAPVHSDGKAPNAQDLHDDGLVHNHDWAVTGK
jgi:hypothetical protein